MQRIKISELKEGMIVGEDVLSPEGQIIVKKNHKLKRQDILKFTFYNVLTVAVIEQPKADARSTDDGKTKETASDCLTDKDVCLSEPKSDTQIKEKISQSESANAVDDSANELPSAIESATEQNKFGRFGNVTSDPRYQKFKKKYVDSVKLLENNLNDIFYRNVEPDESSVIVDAVEIFDRADTSFELFTLLHEMQKVDASTRAHSMNVSILSRLIGTWAGFDKEKLDRLTLAGLLHDIGKLRIPDVILLKPGRLTKEEFGLIKQHTLFGFDAIKDMKLHRDVKDAILLHHEKFDGSGYPFGYKGEKLGDISSIVTIADVYDAMTSKRCYHDAMCPFDVIADFEYDGIKKYNPKYIGMFLGRIANSYVGSHAILSNGKKCKIIYITKDYSRPTVCLDEDDSVLDLTKCKDIKIQAVF